MRPDALNRTSYDGIAAEWERARAAFHGRERDYVDATLAGLPSGARVLDLGCGSARPIAEYVAARGHRITGVDQSTAQLARARARLPHHHWICARLEALPVRGPFDAAICCDALFHVERSYHVTVLAAVRDLLAPGGRLLLSVGGSAHPPFLDRMFERVFYYDSHPPERALELVAEIGLEVVRSEFTELPEPGGNKGKFMIGARRR